MIATPAYSGVSAAYSHSLFESARLDIQCCIYAGDCHVDDARNVLVAEFLDSDCESLVFIDSDIGWTVESLEALLAFDVDIVGATYPFKQDETGYPVRYLGGPLNEDANGLIEVRGLPTGFLRIHRKVLKVLADIAPKFIPKGHNPKPVPLIFERTLTDQHRVGGDNTFCEKAREVGFSVHLAPEIELDHYGESRWSGSWAHFQRCERFGPLSAGLKEIQAGRDTSKTYLDMVAAWDNDWSVDGAMLAAITALSKGKRVLELGSGLSTLAMAAAGAEVHAIEHMPKWSEKVRSVSEQHGLSAYVHDVKLTHYLGIGRWYDVADIGGKTIKAIRPDLVVIDGPPRDEGTRAMVYSLLRVHLDDAVVVADDMNDPNEKQALDAWASSTGRTPIILGQQLRHFAVVPKRVEETRKAS